MTWTSPFTAVVGEAATAADWNASMRDNLLHLRAILPDPSGANDVLTSTSASAAAFSNPSGDTVLLAGSVTGNSTTSAIGVGDLLPNRLVNGSIDATQASAMFADGSIPESVLATAVQNKLIFGGIIFAVRTAAEIPSGWTRETNLNGRLPIGAGTSFSVTFDEGNDYGSSWAHSHGLASHTHGISMGTNAGSGTQLANFSPGGGQTAASSSHGHSLSGTLAAASGTSGDTSWIPPSRAYVYLRRN